MGLIFNNLLKQIPLSIKQLTFRLMPTNCQHVMSLCEHNHPIPQELAVRATIELLKRPELLVTLLAYHMEETEKQEAIAQFQLFMTCDCNWPPVKFQSEVMHFRSLVIRLKPAEWQLTYQEIADLLRVVQSRQQLNRDVRQQQVLIRQGKLSH